MDMAIGSRQQAAKSGDLPPVTAHAVLRYLTRVQGVDLRPIVNRLGRDAGNWVIAAAAAQAFGADLAAVQRAICPPHLEAAVRSGAARIHREGFVLICAGGYVTSVYDKRRIGFRMLSRREGKVGSQRLYRKQR